jgi:hypothetical protein
VGLAACVHANAAEHTLLATPQTVAWGYYSGQSKPALTVHSGDTVRMQALSTCGSPERMIAHGVRATARSTSRRWRLI